MFNFSFLKAEKNADEQIPADSPSPAQSPASGAVNMAREEISQSLETAGKRRGRPRKTADAGASDTKALQAEIIAQNLEGVYDERAWGALLSLPGDGAHTFTGREFWKIGSEERKTLGATGSAAARALMITDPRGLAFLMVASSMLAVYVPRAVQELRHQREEREKRERAKTNAS